jgi:WD40 repeat protein
MIDDQGHGDADVPATAAAPLEMPPPSDGPDCLTVDAFPASVDEQSPPTIRGYQIAGRLGHGGMGTVWRGVQLSTRRTVAIKMLAPGMFGTPRARARFDREVQLTAQLEHPDIARVYESGVAEGVYFYTMELVEGVALDAYVANNRLDRTEVLRLMRRICLAVQHAHQRGVIHRDLKPTNILVAADGAPKVLDFGLAKALRNDEPADGQPLTVDGAVSGTPGFMSPEQAVGRPVDTRSDVYSLGVILYRLLIGRDPHTGERTDGRDGVSGSRPALRGDDSVVRPRAADHSIDRDLESLLLKALARRPDDRYASAGELARDLGNYLGGDPLSAKRPTLTYFMRKRFRKYWLRVTGVGIVCALVLGQAVWWYRRELNQQIEVARDRKASLLANQAMAELNNNRLDLAALLGVAALDTRDTRETRRPLLQLLGAWPGLRGLLHDHRQAVRALAYGPGGKFLVSAGGESTDAAGDYDIRVWTIADTRRPAARLHAHTAPVLALAVSPKWLASADESGAIRLWSLPSGELIWTKPAAHRAPVYALAFNHDGDVLASGGASPPPPPGRAFAPAEIFLWDLTALNAGTGPPRLKQGGDIPARTGSPVCALAFNLDDALLAAGSRPGRDAIPFDEDFGVQVWTLDPHGARFAGLLVDTGPRLRLLKNGITTLMAHPDKEHLICGTDGGEVFVWRWPVTPDVASAAAAANGADWKVMASTATASGTIGDGRVVSLGPSADGDRLLISLSDGSVRSVNGTFGEFQVGLGEVTPVFRSGHPVAVGAFADDGLAWAMAGLWGPDVDGRPSPGAFVAHGRVNADGTVTADPSISAAMPPALLKQRVAGVVNRDFSAEEKARYDLGKE